MYKHQKQVREFMQKFDQSTPDIPALPSVDLLKLRARLMIEEALEFAAAAGFVAAATVSPDFEPIINLVNVRDPDMVKMVDALADEEYVMIGTANTLGVNLEPIFDEVHRSNMSKLWTHNADGVPLAHPTVVKDGGGKVVKPSTYSPANLEPLLVEQGWIP